MTLRGSDGAEIGHLPTSDAEFGRLSRDRSIDGPISRQGTDLTGHAGHEGHAGRRAHVGGRPRAAVVLTAGLCLSGLLVACSGGAAGAEATQAVRLVVPDANIREPADPCSGAGGFRYAHPEAAFEVLADGAVLAAGALPEGRAEKAFSIDLGSDRQPTVCVMSLDVPASIDLSDAELMIGEHGPVPIDPNPALDDVPEAVLR